MCLQGPEGDHAVERALEEPHNFVLKPQREGGGECCNNHTSLLFHLQKKKKKKKKKNLYNKP